MYGLLRIQALRRRVAGTVSGMQSAAAISRRHASGGVLPTLYKGIFRSNIAYLTYVVIGAIGLEYVYSKGIDAAWESNNQGKLFHHIDWSKWHFHLDEEEEEEEEEEGGAEGESEGGEGGEDEGEGKDAADGEGENQSEEEGDVSDQ